MNLELKDVISFVEKALHEQGLFLNKLEKAVLEAAWDDVTYVKISREYELNINSIKGHTAPLLWKKLRRVFGAEIGKKSFRRIITAAITQKSSDKSTQDLDSNVVLTVTGAALPDTSGFVGRAEELDRLSKLVHSYSFLSVVGPDGIGKRTLVSKLMESRHSLPCERILWKPLHHRPTPDLLEEEMLAAMGVGRESELLTHLQLHPTLIIFDETGTQLLSSGHISLIRRISEETPSRVITISTCPLQEFDNLVLRGKAISYRLQGLKPAEAKFLLHKRWHSEAEELCKAVGGNPLLLKKINGWYDYFGEPTNVNRLSVLDGLVGNFYDNILTGSVLSTAEMTLLKDIATSTQGISFVDLLSKRPERAPLIRRLIEMGVAHKTGSENTLRLDPLLGYKLLGAV